MMPKEPIAKITISMPRELVTFADRLAGEKSTSRSGVIADLLRKAQEEQIEALMAEGYREMAEENLALAEQALTLTAEVMLRND